MEDTKETSPSKSTGLMRIWIPRGWGSIHRSAPHGVLEPKGEADPSPRPQPQQLPPADSHLRMKNQFSWRESHWGNKPLSRAGHRARSRCQHKANSMASLEVLCLTMLLGHFFLPYWSFVCVLCLLVRVLWDSHVCEHVCLCSHMFLELFPQLFLFFCCIPV